MSFHNLFADGQSDTGAGIFLPAVKPLEDDEDALGVLRGNADAVVPYGESPPAAISVGPDVNAGRLVAPKLDCVSDQEPWAMPLEFRILREPWHSNP